MTLIEDIELIARELVENAVAPKQKRLSAQEHKAVTELLVSKDKELKEALEPNGNNSHLVGILC